MKACVVYDTCLLLIGCKDMVYTLRDSIVEGCFKPKISENLVKFETSLFKNDRWSYCTDRRLDKLVQSSVNESTRRPLLTVNGKPPYRTQTDCSRCSC